MGRASPAESHEKLRNFYFFNLFIAFFKANPIGSQPITHNTPW
jgi:hypothetical protein